jgi:hypothetical protein
MGRGRKWWFQGRFCGVVKSIRERVADGLAGIRFFFVDDDGVMHGIGPRFLQRAADGARAACAPDFGGCDGQGARDFRQLVYIVGRIKAQFKAARVGMAGGVVFRALRERFEVSAFDGTIFAPAASASTICGLQFLRLRSG